jgi:hypothetical protein
MLGNAMAKLEELWNKAFGPDPRIPIWKVTYKNAPQRIWLQGKSTMLTALVLGVLALVFKSERKAFVGVIESLYSMGAELTLLVIAFAAVTPTMLLRRVRWFGPKILAVSLFVVTAAFDQASVVIGALVGMAIPTTIALGFLRGVLGTLLLVTVMLGYQAITVVLAQAQKADLKQTPRQWRVAIYLLFGITGVVMAYAFTIDPNLHSKA